MPLSKKGEKIMAAMKKQYGEEEGERVFYKSKNAGTIEGVDALVAFDPMGRQAVTYVTQPDGSVVAYDLFGREVSLFEEEDSMRSLFSMGDAGGAFMVVGDARPSQTSVQLYDNLEIDDAAKVSFTDDGFMKAMPRIARTGIQIYAGDECGITFKDQVRVYRPPSSVFDAKALHSYTQKRVSMLHQALIVPEA
jgi:hypothetical protein